MENVSIPYIGLNEENEVPKKIFGKPDETSVTNAMQVALRRYEKELEQRKFQRESDLKIFKENIIKDQKQMEQDRLLLKAK